MTEVLTLEQARTERLRAECLRLMAEAARIDGSTPDGRRAKDAVVAHIDQILDQLGLTLPDELWTMDLRQHSRAPGRERSDAAAE